MCEKKHKLRYPLLEEFLKERNLLETFENQLLFEITQAEGRMAIYKAFLWTESKEGLAFWTKVNAEWQQSYLKDKRKKKKGEKMTQEKKSSKAPKAFRFDYPRLERFLKKRRLYSKFRRYQKVAIFEEDGDSAIAVAFPWYKTPEGEAFWERISDEWRISMRRTEDPKLDYPELESFLAKKKALSCFRRNIQADVTEKLGADAIVGAFYWHTSPEGKDYWAKLDREWIDHLNKKETKNDSQ